MSSAPNFIPVSANAAIINAPSPSIDPSQVDGLNKSIENYRNSMNDEMFSAPTFNFTLTKEQLLEAVPGTIRKAKHFIAVVRLVIEFFKNKLEGLFLFYNLTIII